MDKDKIKELAKIAFEKQERYQNLAVMNQPDKYEDRLVAAQNFALAQAEAMEAERNLRKEQQHG